MSTQLAVIQGGPPAIAGQVKSRLNAAAQANVQASFAVIGYKGKNWRIKYRGEDTLLTDPTTGLPQQALDVVVVGVAAGISKQWYDKGYVDGDNAAPDCFSVNGQTPDPSSPKKQHATCATCPRNQWGSKISDNGSKGKACQDARRVAIVPDGDLENEMFGGPVMLRLPPMSLGNFATYGGMLDKRGAGLEYVVTRMTFDHDVAYPRINFAPLRWLTQDEAMMIVGPDGQSGICAHPQIDRILSEAVDEVAHDPAGSPNAGGDADPLAQGGPAQVFQQPSPPAPVAPVQTAPAPAPEPAPQPQPQPTATPARGFGGAAATTVAQPAQPAPVKRGFGGAAPVQQAQQPAQTVQQPVQTAQPVDRTPAPIQQANAVQGAPSDMEAAINDLLNAPI